MEFLRDEIEMLKSQLDLLQKENKRLKEERNDVVNEVSKLVDGVDRGSPITFSEFSLFDLRKATQNFNDSHKIGKGGFGSVYKGSLCNSMVVIKLPPQSLQGRLDLEQEVSILRTVKHPNLVTLLGTCSENSALVYEYLPNGSLKNRLACQGGSSPLTWQERTRIIGEIFWALRFLHSCKPNPIVHGNLKVANILLDANLISKLSDFGISRLVIEASSNILGYRIRYPRKTFAYMAPESTSNGEITVKSDVYSFGIIVLQLLTGKSPINITNRVKNAIDAELLNSCIDKSAGEWPLSQAEKLAELGLRCAHPERRMRADLNTEEKLIKSLTKDYPLLMKDDILSMLPSFKCPISLEIMKNPHIAADGYTYEAEAIKRWFDSGRLTSPMTNLRLHHLELTPNHALRSAIQEWLLQHP